MDDWTIARAFSQSCVRWGPKPAIASGDQILTYQDLETASNHVVGQLIEAGAGEGDVVALACPGVAEFAIGALATVKLGAAYLSIDLRYPLSRARDMLTDAQPKLMLGAGELAALCPERTTLVSGAFDGLGRQAGASSVSFADRPAARGSAYSAAYLCYTSGTTGAPKGVVVNHAGIHGLVNHPEFTMLREGARVASCSTLAFDAITFEVWGALLCGACVVETPRALLQSPWELAAFFETAAIDGLFLTTSLFNAVAARCPGAFGKMQALVIGGEALDPVSVARVMNGPSPPKRILNGYGPTETTTFATCHVVGAEDLSRGVIPIGRPIDGRSVCILKASGESAAPGEEGELCIGGVAVAAGYINDPELTATKFTTSSAGAGQRLYRTGDLCRMTSEGVVEYLGRIDDQVKIKGYRIEPTGVAALLTRLEGVEEAVVLPRPGPFGSKELVAFVRGDEVMSGEALRRAAHCIMPDYMAPSLVRWVQDFPLKSNGKLDAEALLTSAKSASSVIGLDDGADDSIGARVLEIWRRHARHTDFDLDTPFIEIGDSLGIVNLMIEVEDVFGRRLSVDDAIPAMTVRSMSAVLEGHARPTPAGAAKNQVFLISAPWNMVRHPEELGQAISQGASWKQLQIPPSPDLERAYGSIGVMAQELERQIVEENPSGPYVLVGFSFAGVLAFEVARRLEAYRDAGVKVILIDSFITRERTWPDRLWTGLRKMIVCLLTDPAYLFPQRAYEGFSPERLASLGASTLDPKGLLEKCKDVLGSYEPKPINGDLMLVRCTRYSQIHARPAYSKLRLSQPWTRLAKGAVSSFDVDLSHEAIMESPQFHEALSRRIKALGEAEPAAKSPKPSAQCTSMALDACPV